MSTPYHYLNGYLPPSPELLYALFPRTSSFESGTASTLYTFDANHDLQSWMLFAVGAVDMVDAVGVADVVGTVGAAGVTDVVDMVGTVGVADTVDAVGTVDVADAVDAAGVVDAMDAADLVDAVDVLDGAEQSGGAWGGEKEAYTVF